MPSNPVSQPRVSVLHSNDGQFAWVQLKMEELMLQPRRVFPPIVDGHCGVRRCQYSSGLERRLPLYPAQLLRRAELQLSMH